MYYVGLQYCKHYRSSLAALCVWWRHLANANKRRVEVNWIKLPEP